MPETNYQLPDGRTIVVVQPSAPVRKFSAEWREGPDFFNRFKDTLLTAINRWPTDSYFAVPPSTTVLTYCARLRDARLANDRFRYDPELADRYKAVPELTIAIDAATQSVVFRHSQVRGRRKQQELKTELMPDVTSQRPLRPLTVIETEALALLIAHNLIAGPFRVQGEMNAEVCVDLESRLNVSFLYDEPTKTTIIA
jgi:hypothetical protein